MFRLLRVWVLPSLSFAFIISRAGMSTALMVLSTWIVGAVLMTAIHELGHALVGAVLGFRIHQLSVGTGKTVFRFRLGRVDIRIRALLLNGGFVMAVTKSARLYRTREIAFLLGGVSLPLLVAWMGRNLAQSSNAFVAGSYVTFVWFSILGAIGNLLPRQLDDGQQTDGKQILHTLGMSRADVIERVSRHDQARQSFAFDDLMMDGAATTSKGETTAELAAVGVKVAEAAPDDCNANNQAAVGLLLDDRFAEALPFAERALALGSRDPEVKEQGAALLRNNVAYALAVLGDPSTMQRATELAREAYAIRADPSVAGTLGACLVQSGDPVKGDELLRTSINSAKRPSDRFQTQRFLMIGALARRDAFGARRAFQAGMTLVRSGQIADPASLTELRPRLGAAEAVLWLGRAAQGLLPRPEELGPDGLVLADALGAWADPKLANDLRWRLFAEQGGDPATVTAESLGALMDFARSLVSPAQPSGLAVAASWR